MRRSTIVIGLGWLLCSTWVVATPRPAYTWDGRTVRITTTSHGTGRSFSLSRELIRLEKMISELGGDPVLARTILKAGIELEIDPVLLASVAYVESRYKPSAVSGKGAAGIMQLRPVVLNVPGIIDPHDPHDNVMGGAAYLRHCFERYKRQAESTHLALAAYNVGPGPADKLRASEPGKRFVNKVLTVYNRFTDEPIPLKGSPVRR